MRKKSQQANPWIRKLKSIRRYELYGWNIIPFSLGQKNIGARNQVLGLQSLVLHIIKTFIFLYVVCLSLSLCFSKKFILGIESISIVLMLDKLIIWV